MGYNNRRPERLLQRFFEKKGLRLFISCVLLALVVVTAQAQNPLPESNPDRVFDAAHDLYTRGQYLASRRSFEQYLRSYPEHYRSVEAQYFVANNAIRQGDSDAESLMNDFVKTNPSHPKAVNAYFELGSHYFDLGQYRKAIGFYKKVDFSAMGLNRANEGRFKWGYSHYSIKQNDEALTHFQRVTREPFLYQARYYAGYIYYEQKAYSEAVTNFLQASRDAQYKQISARPLLASYLALKEYDQLIQYIDGLGTVKLQRDIQLIEAEAYYYKQDYSKAAEIYELALASNPSKISPLIYYHRGQANYKINNESKAIDAFKLAALSADTIGQYSSYYLGILYNNAGNKPFALNAFEKASTEAHNPEIKEEASYRLGQINYELGQFAACITKLNDFLKEFPSSKYRDRVNDLISDAYLRTNNYDLAIRHIEGLKERTASMDRVYQQVTLLKGTQLFNDSKFAEAIVLFNKSLSVSADMNSTIAANYWKGEAYSIGRKWIDAINAYSRVVFNRSNVDSPYYLKARYGLGYAYYNSKVYDRAKIQFAEYTKALTGSYDQPDYLDALIRLADCYFIEKNYGAAISNYENALRGRSKDRAYIYLQLGLNYGFQNNLDRARRNFELVMTGHKETRESERAAYQLAQLDFENSAYDRAVTEFSFLIDNYPQSKLIPNALVKRAVCYNNLSQSDNAIDDYRRVLDDYITHQVANSALLGLQEVATSASGNIDVDAYIQKFRLANPNDTSLESIEFEAAKRRYFDQDYEGAIARFKEFQNNYPESSLAGEAIYFIADSYYRSGNDDEALNHYYQVLDYPQMSYLNRSVYRLAALEFERANYDVAIKHYRLLGSLARTKRETYNSLEGLMIAYDKIGQTDSIEWYANKILGQGQVSTNGVSSANLYLGKAAMADGAFDPAKDYFSKTVEIALDENAAEATYLSGLILNKQSLYKESNELLFEMNSKFSVYEYWLGMSFLLIAENYLALDELFQAEATLQSIIENSPEDEIVRKAEDMLGELKVKQEEILSETDSLVNDSTNSIDGN